MLKTTSYRHGRRGALLTFLLIATGLLLTADNAHAQVVRTVDKEFTDSLVNPCTGETIGFTGSMTTTSSVQDNGFRTNFRFTTDVKGRGVVIINAFGQPVTNGTEFKVQSRVKSVNDQLDPVVYPFTQSQEIDMKLVGAGGENNFFFRFTARLVINAQGDLTVFKENSDLRCELVPAFTKPILLYDRTILSPEVYYDQY
ncbi:MAG TPA: hypothetical protein VFZ44_10035 [Pyrinomonadaceae bacterium]